MSVCGTDVCAWVCVWGGHIFADYAIVLFSSLAMLLHSWTKRVGPCSSQECIKSILEATPVPKSLIKFCNNKYGNNFD